MPRNDTTQATVNTARAAMVSAMVTFVTSTLPSLHDATAAAVVAMDPQHPMLDGFAAEDMRFYRACVQYVNELRNKGRYAGNALRYP